MQILFLSRWFPYPADNGAKIRILNLIKHLGDHHQVSLLSFGESGEATETDLFHLQEYCSSVSVLARREFRAGSARAFVGFASRQPRSLVDTFRHEMREAVRHHASRNGCDVIVASQLDMLPYALDLPGIPAVLEELEVGAFEDAYGAAGGVGRRWRAWLTWVKLSIYLRRVLPRFAACTVASEIERDRVRRIAPHYANVHVIPNALDLTLYRGPFGDPAPNTVVYSGALTYQPNYEAVDEFLSRVYPLVRKRVPEVQLRVTGRSKPGQISALPTRIGVEFTGHVADVRPLIAESWVSVVPIRSGGGTRLKILEAMAMGTPVVSTSKGAEGLAVTDGIDILLADEPEVFAGKIIHLLQSREMRRRLSAGGKALVGAKYDARRAGRDLRGLIERAAVAGTT